MLSRRSTLFFSVLVSLVIYGVLFAVAPSIAVLQARAPEDALVRTFKVQLAQDPVVEPLQEAREGDRLPDRPESIEDLLGRDTDSLTPGDTEGQQYDDPAAMAERLGSEFLDRDHDLRQDEAVVEKMDAKILEIAEQAARQDIEITRRMVKPSPDRYLGDDEMPTLRGDGLDDEAEVLLFSRRGTPTGAGTDEDGEKGDDALPEGEDSFEDWNSVIASKEELPELPAETQVVRAPVKREIQAASDYEFLDDLVDIQLNTYVPGNGEKGFFRLQIIPKQQNLEVLPKDVTFVIDASSSILQRKLDRTVDGLQRILDMLEPKDLFNIIVFRDTPSPFRPDRVPATEENRAAAKAFIEGLESYGETDVYRAIEPVMQALARDGEPSVVFVMTDGRPTAGVKDGRTIINALTDENRGRHTVYAYGGGRTVNRYLLDLLAYRNKGESYVTPEIDQIDAELPRFFARISEPILVDLEADYGRIDETDVFPRKIPDFYRGRVVTVYGRYQPEKDKEFSVRLTGLAGNKKKELVFRTNLSQGGAGDASIAQRWAFERIYWLIGEICRVGETPDLLQELRNLSAKYNITTSYSE